jgi:isopentenyldiphosphate isomerase
LQHPAVSFHLQAVIVTNRYYCKIQWAWKNTVCAGTVVRTEKHIAVVQRDVERLGL